MTSAHKLKTAIDKKVLVVTAIFRIKIKSLSSELSLRKKEPRPGGETAVCYAVEA
jgi:hypothetical protein